MYDWAMYSVGNHYGWQTSHEYGDGDVVAVSEIMLALNFYLTI